MELKNFSPASSNYASDPQSNLCLISDPAFLIMMITLMGWEMHFVLSEDVCAGRRRSGCRQRGRRCCGGWGGRR